MSKPLEIIGSGQACEILGIHRATLSRWVNAGRIACWVKLPSGACLFDLAVVEAMAKEDAA